MMEDQETKIRNAGAAISSVGLSAKDLKTACEKAARQIAKAGITIWALTAV